MAVASKAPNTAPICSAGANFRTWIGASVLIYEAFATGCLKQRFWMHRCGTLGRVVNLFARVDWVLDKGTCMSESGCTFAPGDDS